MTSHTTRHGVVRTVYDPPPIPTWGQFAWHATHKDHDGGDPIGYGPTEAEAIADLLEQLDEDCDDDPREREYEERRRYFDQHDRSEP